MESKRLKEKDRIVWRNDKGQLHRLDGPAVETIMGTKSWWVNGQLHREDGPARIWFDDIMEWHLTGVQYTQEQWEVEVMKIKLNRIKDL